MTVDEASASSSSHGGRTFYFCSPSCQAAFNRSPNEYERLADVIPPPLARLPELARNLWWSWHPEARALFGALKPPSEEPVHDNPLQLLLGLDRQTLERYAHDTEFLARYRRVLAMFDADLAPRGSQRGSLLEPIGPGPIAYFSAEFGVHSALPVYSGGLGVLAGDIAKEASDLGVPLVGVGFMYPQGYFRQRVSADGHQEEVYEHLRLPLAPAAPACTEAGLPCVVAIQLPDRVVQTAVSVVRVGRVPLYLMDTDLEPNAPDDRVLSARLYGGDQELRIRQEILLGIGGVRLLRALGIAPGVWHANEGHAAFMMVERVRELVADGRPFDRAVEEVKASTVFTTHTPVPAGHDIFSVALVEKYLGTYWPQLGLSRDQFLALGTHDASPGLNMTALALRLSGHRNAVSRRHGEVSRRMWRRLWSGIPETKIPITFVTNGVHVPSWVGPEMARLYRTYLGEDWLDWHDALDLWGRVDAIPGRELWEAHRTLKGRLVKFLRDRAARRRTHGLDGAGQSVAAGALLDPEALTLGFARRFATYKRAALILRDPVRLKMLVTDRQRPVQIVFAGKAHPADEPGKQVLRTVYQAAADPAYEGRIAFIEDYDMHVAQHLVQGVDVWLNTPQPPHEASGTSGQKAAINGVPNLSVLDGWWAEAYDETNGWAVGDARADVDEASRDAVDAEALYGLLEMKVVSLYYDRGIDGTPRGWLRVMKRAIQTVTPRFSARRMVREYVERLYTPAARQKVDHE